MVETYTNPTYGYGILGSCLIQTGHSEDATPLLERAIRVNPLGFYLVQRLTGLGSAHVYLGHNEQAIQWLERALAVYPAYRDSFPGGLNRELAVAYAGVGRDADARRALAVADRDWPFDTVRGHWPDDINPVF
ncbi:MAG: tetratricopeptide repeat protein, partial [Rhodopila sp.]